MPRPRYAVFFTRCIRRCRSAMPTRMPNRRAGGKREGEGDRRKASAPVEAACPAPRPTVGCTRMIDAQTGPPDAGTRPLRVVHVVGGSLTGCTRMVLGLVEGHDRRRFA